MLVLGLAKATGWSEEKIWHMPYAKALMFWHAHLVTEGVRTRWLASIAMSAEARQKLQSKLDAFFENV